MRFVVAMVGVAAVVVGTGGCASRSMSNTQRTAIEQLLLSGAVDRSVEKVELPEVSGKTVFVDTANLKAYDVEYIRVALRARMAELGGRLVDSAEGADYVAEVSSGGLGTEFKTGLVGIPAIPVPQAPVPLPEVPLYKTVEQTGIFKLLVFVHSQGKFVAAGRYYGKYDRDESFVLFWRFQRHDDIRSGWERADAEDVIGKEG